MWQKINFYSHASCEARPERGTSSPFPLDLYSHASCEARQLYFHKCVRSDHFYSHASCEARLLRSLNATEDKNFYSHASCEARQLLCGPFVAPGVFLLTRLLRGATFVLSIFWIPDKNFYSHASCEARPAVPSSILTYMIISTHTPLARRDHISCSH